MSCKAKFEKQLGLAWEDIEADVKRHIQVWLEQTDVKHGEITFISLKLYGSWLDGIPTDTSDIDVMAGYRGRIREDDAFNGLNNEKLIVTDVNGGNRAVDINPVKVANSYFITSYFPAPQNFK